MIRKLNWKPSRPDHRDMVYMARPGLIIPTKIPQLTLDIKAWDQGNLGSCTGHGVGRIDAFRYQKEKGTFVMPSRLFIYYNGRFIEKSVNEDSGCEIRDIMKGIAQYGVCPETDFPYDENKFTHKPSTKAFKDGLRDIALTYKSIPATVDAVKASIASGNPVVGGFNVFESFMSDLVAKTGKMPMPSRKEKSEGGHCVVWDGYDDSDETFWCANSWGEWGINGWFKMPYANMKNCSDFWNLTLVK